MYKVCCICKGLTFLSCVNFGIIKTPKRICLDCSFFYLDHTFPWLSLILYVRESKICLIWELFFPCERNPQVNAPRLMWLHQGRQAVTSLLFSFFYILSVEFCFLSQKGCCWFQCHIHTQETGRSKQKGQKRSSSSVLAINELSQKSLQMISIHIFLA